MEARTWVFWLSIRTLFIGLSLFLGWQGGDFYCWVDVNTNGTIAIVETKEKSLLLRKGPVCPYCHALGLLGRGRAPRSPSNWAVIHSEWYQVAVCFPPRLHDFSGSPFLSSNKIANIMQGYLFTCSFQLSKPHCGFRCPEEKEIKLHHGPSG